MQAIKQFIIWLAFVFACFLPASALTLTAPENCVWEISSIGYDEPTAEATDLGNRTETPTSNYDAASIHRTATETKSTEAERPLVGQNAEFKAAEGASGLGDLTTTEVEQIQSVVNTAQRPLDVVGSAARGARGAESDIDYTTANANLQNFEGLEDQLPSLDPEHGILRGYPDGSSIRFEPGGPPQFIPRP